ncbi:hypothetical protein Tco_0734688 [Tanacetum coccineum]
MAKRSTVDLEEDDEEEEQSRQVSRWTREEEILLCQCWVEVSENNEIKADRNEDSFWGRLWKISTKCSIKGEKVFTRLRVAYLKKNTPNGTCPSDADDHTEIFCPDVRPRPVGKPRPAKKTKKETTESSGRSQSRSISEFLMIDTDALPEPKASII